MTSSTIRVIRWTLCCCRGQYASRAQCNISKCKEPIDILDARFVDRWSLDKANRWTAISWKEVFISGEAIFPKQDIVSDGKYSRKLLWPCHPAIQPFAAAGGHRRSCVAISACRTGREAQGWLNCFAAIAAVMVPVVSVFSAKEKRNPNVAEDFKPRVT